MKTKKWSGHACKIIVQEYCFIRVATLAVIVCLATCVTVKAVANSLVGQVLAGPLYISQGRNKVPFYKKQQIKVLGLFLTCSACYIMIQ